MTVQPKTGASPQNFPFGPRSNFSDGIGSDGIAGSNRNNYQSILIKRKMIKWMSPWVLWRRSRTFCYWTTLLRIWDHLFVHWCRNRLVCRSSTRPCTSPSPTLPAARPAPPSAHPPSRPVKDKQLLSSTDLKLVSFLDYCIISCHCWLLIPIEYVFIVFQWLIVEMGNWNGMWAWPSSSSA